MARGYPRFEQGRRNMQYDLIFEEIRSLLAHDKVERLNELLVTLDPADLADLLEWLEPEARETVFRMLDDELASHVVAELEHQALEAFVEDLSQEEIARILANMAPDDAADFMEELELPLESERQLLAMMPDESRQKLADLMRYEEYSGGSIMTPERCALPADTTVQDAVKAIGAAELSDPIMYVYVVEPKTGVLLGYVYLSEIMGKLQLSGHGEEIRLDSMIHECPVWAKPGDDQEEIARDFRKYNLWVMPVVDEKHRLVGRITADDIMDVIQEEADDDMARMVGVSDFEELESSPVKSARARLPWLLVTMLFGLVNSLLFGQIQEHTMTVAVIFVPVLMAMGGNTSMQSTAIIIREIALGRCQGRIRRLLTDQLSAGVMMGVVAAAIVWCGTFLLLTIFPNYMLNPQGVAETTTVSMASAVSTAMFVGMVFASVFGSVVPIVLERLQVDPAVASGPFVTTSNDISSSLIYFGICLMIL